MRPPTADVHLTSDPLPSRRGPLARVSRRRFLGASAALALSAMMPHARAAVFAPDVRTLSFVHTHTGERLTLPFAGKYGYLSDALATLDRFLRDFRTGAVHPIDPGLFDQLHTLASVTGSTAPFQVISGYRSPVTNQALRAHSSGVAQHSLHLEGRAIDVRLADVALADLRDAALSLRGGGVGYYPESQFVHIDTGPVRHW